MARSGLFEIRRTKQKKKGQNLRATLPKKKKKGHDPAYHRKKKIGSSGVDIDDEPKGGQTKHQGGKKKRGKKRKGRTVRSQQRKGEILLLLHEGISTKKRMMQTKDRHYEEVKEKERATPALSKKDFLLSQAKGVFKVRAQKMKKKKTNHRRKKRVGSNAAGRGKTDRLPLSRNEKGGVLY